MPALADPIKAIKYTVGAICSAWFNSLIAYSLHNALHNTYFSNGETAPELLDKSTPI